MLIASMLDEGRLRADTPRFLPPVQPSVADGALVASPRVTPALQLTVLSPELEAAVWRTALCHRRRSTVQAASCELLAEILREDFRRLAAGRKDLLCVHPEETLQQALRRMTRHLASVLEEHAREYQVQRPCCLATSALLAIAQEGERRAAPADSERRTAADKQAGVSYVSYVAYVTYVTYVTYVHDGYVTYVT